MRLSDSNGYCQARIVRIKPEIAISITQCPIIYERSSHHYLIFLENHSPKLKNFSIDSSGCEMHFLVKKMGKKLIFLLIIKWITFNCKADAASHGMVRSG